MGELFVKRVSPSVGFVLYTISVPLRHERATGRYETLADADMPSLLMVTAHGLQA